MGHLASISQDKIQHTSFSKLTILQIIGCSKLKYLFCNNIAKRLEQLQKLKIDRCESMEAIIMNEGTCDGIINFPKLKSLKISNMPSLASFYAEKENMHSGSTLWMDPSAQYHSLFDGMVAFPSLEILEIEDLAVISVIWGKDCYNDTVSSFCKLNYLYVLGCDKLESMIPPSVASHLTHLKEMTVGFCSKMREIIEAGEQVITDGPLFPELTVLYLSELPSLTSFWCYQSGKANTCKVPLTLPRLSSISLYKLPDLKSFFHGANFEFHVPALKKVEVGICNGLSTLFTFPVFRKFQLETLEVYSCELLENIVEDLRGDETCDKIITLFQLTSVMFENLTNLKSFFHNANYEFRMPVLKEVKVVNCGFPDTLFKRSVFRNLKQLKKLEVSDCRLLEGIIEDVRVDESSDISKRIITLSQLLFLDLKDLPNLKSLFHGANYECNMPVLTEVKVVNCGLPTLFTFSVYRELQQLKELEVVDCRLLEHIVENVRGDETSDTEDILFPELTILRLINLPSLTNFWSYQNGKANTCKVPLTLPRLSSISLFYLPNLKSFFHGANFEFYIPALRIVNIVGCGLSILFTCSVFREIRQLQNLHVSDCASLERIVEEVGGDETSEIEGKSIISSQLSTIILESLPNLKSFSCTSSYVFNMPKLQNFLLIKCPQIEYFSSSKTNTSLVRVASDWYSEEDFQDLNDYIRQNRKRGSYLSDCAGESSYRSLEWSTETQSETIEEEQPQETETGQPDSSV